jgi:hypothetical protein
LRFTATPGIRRTWKSGSIRRENNASRVVAAIDAFGFGSLGITAADLTQPSAVIQFGQPPNRIDLLTKLEGLDAFGPAYERRAILESEWGPTPFIDLETLRVNKRAVGRYQDLADLEALR